MNFWWILQKYIPTEITEYMVAVEPLYFGHPWDRKVFQIERGVLISGVKMYTILMFGTAQAVLIRGVSIFQGVLIREVSLFQGVLIREVSLFQGVLIRGVSLFQGVLISGCPYFRGVLISGVSLFQGVLISGVSLFQSVFLSFSPSPSLSSSSPLSTYKLYLISSHLTIHHCH